MFSLGQLNLRRRNLEAALIHCRQALRGQRKTKSIGRRHVDYISSLRLLAIIYWAKDNKVKAVAYADLLPKHQQLQPGEFDRNLDEVYRWSATGVEHNELHIDRTARNDPQLRGNHMPTRSATNTVRPMDRVSVDASSCISEPIEQLNDDDKPEKATEASTAAKHTSAIPFVASDSEASQSTVKDPLRQSPIAKQDSDKLLVAAAKSGDIKLARSLFAEPGKYTRPETETRAFDDFAKTPLILAATGGFPDFCEFMLDQGADVNARSCHGDTALLLSTVHEHLGCVRLLLKRGADVEASNEAEMRPLTFAHKLRNSDLIGILDRYGAKPLHVNSTKAVVGDSKGAILTTSSPGKTSEPPLQDSSLGRTFLKQRSKGSIIDEATVQTESPSSMIAALTSDSFVLESEDDQDRMDSNIRSTHQGVRSLKEQGMNKPVKANGALLWAAKKGHLHVVNLLLRSGGDADINIKDKGFTSQRETPLHLTAKNNHVDICKRLITKGASVEAMDSHHLTP